MGIISKVLSSIFGAGNKQDSSIAYERRVDCRDEFIKYQKCNSLPDDYIVFDLETTGLDPIENKIIEIGAIKFINNKKTEEFHTYVYPGIHIPYNITNITGITDDDVRNAPRISNILPDFLCFIGDYVLIAHNADFDMKFLLNNVYNIGKEKPRNKVVDTLYLAKNNIKGLQNYKLETLKKHLKISAGSHNALDDCLVCAEVYKRCKSNKSTSTKKTDSGETMKEKTLTEKTLTEEEQSCLDIVKEILIRNGRDIDKIKSLHTGNYFDILNFYTLVRFKLNGKKKYILSKLTEKEIKRIWNEALCEGAVKSETGITRILYNSPKDLYKLEEIIIQDYDSCVESNDIYRQNVKCAEKQIRDYMNL